MADDQTADTATSGRIRANGLIYAVIDSPGDQDWFAVDLVAGHSYRIDMFGAFGGIFGLRDPLIFSVFDDGANALPGTKQDDVEPGVNLDSSLLFTPAASGTYFIAAAGIVYNEEPEAASTGSYALAVTDLSAPDLAADVSTAGRVRAGPSGVQGNIETAGDTDWLRVQLVAGHSYRVEVSGLEYLFGTLVNPVLLGIHFDGALLPFSGDDNRPGSLGATVTLLAPEDGAYFIDVGAFGDTTGTYRVTVTDLRLRDLADGIDTAGRVATNGTLGRHESATDVDWYRVTFKPGVTYVIEMLGRDTGHGTLADPVILGVFDSAGVARPEFGITRDEDGGLGHNSRLRFTPTEGGTYFIAAGDAQGEIGTYRLSVRASRPADLPANTTTTAEAVVGGSVLGQIDKAGDVDWFRAALLPGHACRIDFTAKTGEGAPALGDPFLLGLYAADGTLLEGTANDDFGTGVNSRVTFTSPGGELFIAAGGYGIARGVFRLAITDVSAPDLASGTGTLGRLAVNGQVGGLIDEPGDEDWFRVTLVGGRVYAFEANDNPGSPSPIGDPRITGIFDAAGVAIPGTAVDDYGESRDARSVLIAPGSGTFFLGVAGNADSNGEYFASLRDITRVVDLEPADTGTTRRVAVGGAATGVINSARDEDWFGVELLSGTAYAFSLRGEASGNGTLINPQILGIYDPNGVLIPGTPNDDAPGTSDARTVFRPSVTGLYYLGAAGAPSDEGSYRVSIEVVDIGTDVAGNPLTTARALPDGAPYGGQINVLADVDWIGIPVRGGTTYAVHLRGSGTGALADPEIIGFFDQQGRALGSQRLTADSSGKDDEAVVGAAADGTIYVAVQSANLGTGGYQLEVDKLPNFDLAPPRLVAVSPAEGSTSVNTFANLTFVFSEEIKAGTGDIVLSTPGASDSHIAATDPRVKISGRTMTLDLDGPLPSGRELGVHLTAGAVTDVNGNAFGGQTAAEATHFTTTTSTAASWTLMIYLDGDNNLERNAVEDLNEMERVAGLRAQGINVVVLADRAVGESASSGDWTDTRFGRISPDSDIDVASSLSSAATSQGELNMGDPATLTKFINSAAALAPAQKYGLVIWDHGGGLSGAAWDSGSNGDHLTVKEIRSAIDASAVDHFDLINFDCCQMGIAEVAFALRDLCSVYVGSEMNEPGDGNSYELILESLQANPAMTEAELAQSIVSAYEAENWGKRDITLSALNTGALAPVADALNDFVGQALVSRTILSEALALTAAAAVVQRFPKQDGTAGDLVDYMQRVKQLAVTAELDDAAQAVIDAVNDAVFAKTGTVPRAGGLAINLATFGPVQNDYTADNYADFFIAVPLWRTFLELI